MMQVTAGVTQHSEYSPAASSVKLAHPDVVQGLQQERLLVEVERNQVPASKLRAQSQAVDG